MSIRIIFETNIKTTKDETNMVTENSSIYRDLETVENRINQYIDTHVAHYYHNSYNHVLGVVKVKLYIDNKIVNVEINDAKLANIIRHNTKYKLPLEVISELSEDIITDKVISCKLNFYMLENTVRQKIDITHLFDIDEVLGNAKEITKFVEHIHQAAILFNSITYSLVIDNNGVSESYTGRITNNILTDLIPLNNAKHATSMVDLILYMKNHKE